MFVVGLCVYIKSSKKDFCKLKWSCKIKHMSDEKIPFKLLANEWDEVKSKGHLKECWLAHVNSLKKELNLQDKMLEINQRSP